MRSRVANLHTRHFAHRALALVFACAFASCAAQTAHAVCQPLPASEDRCYKPPYLSVQWATVFPNEGKVYHVVEGICKHAECGIADDCLSHTFYDWNMDLIVDPQYQCMITDGTNTIHTERESNSLPTWVWPSPGDPNIDSDGDRVWMAGEFIYDCGHCAGGSDLTGCYTEIHPIMGIATIRDRADTLIASGRSGYVPATRADVWIYGDAGCANAIQCEDDNANCPPPWPTLALCSVPGVQPYPITRVWMFTIALPPRPVSNATPVWRFEARPGDRFPSLRPTVTYLPASNGGQRDSLRIEINLLGATNPGPFARSIVAGWNPGTANLPIHHFRVDFTGIKINDDLDGLLQEGGEWYYWASVNGLWQTIFGNVRTQTPTAVYTGQQLRLTQSFDFAIADTGAITLASLGFDDDAVLGCTIVNGNPGGIAARWTKAQNFGIGTHTVTTSGGDAAAATIQYRITELTGAPLVASVTSGETPSGYSLEADRTVAGPSGVHFTITAAPDAPPVSVRIFNAAGALVRTIATDRLLGAGRAGLAWDGRDDRDALVVSGVYMAVLQAAGADVASARVVLVR
jgi:hypothetical protein